MNISDFYEFKSMFTVTRLIEGYKYIGITEGVCSGNPVISGTRIEPKHIVNYGTIEEIMEDFDLTREEVEEAFRFMSR